jgi:hypothetical protein
LSKQRAIRRAEREAAAEVARAARERRERRRRRVRAVRSRLTPRVGRTGRLFARRSRTERAGIAVPVALALLLIWFVVDPLAGRIGLSALVLLVTPVLVVLVLDRRI